MCCRTDFAASATMASLATAIARKSWHCAGSYFGMVPTARADPPADYRDRFETLTGQSLRACPHCQTGVMAVISCIPRPMACQLGPDTS